MKKKRTACVVVGAAGRMGQRLCRLLTDSRDLCITGAVESSGSSHCGQSLKEAFGIPQEQVMISCSLEEIRSDFDVIIDFTFPDVSVKTASFASRNSKHAVIGSTGFSDEQMRLLQELSQSFPCVCAPNMSLGVNTLFKLVADAAGILQQDYDAEIVEIHHRHKKDAPSGTAIRIAEILAESYGRDLSKVGVYQRRGFIGERTAEEIGVQTLRAGDVVGEHTVLFGGSGERLELIHRAQNRDCFARGALYAAGWVVGKPNGLYDMQDVLGLRD